MLNAGRVPWLPGVGADFHIAIYKMFQSARFLFEIVLIIFLVNLFNNCLLQFTLGPELQRLPEGEER